MSPQNLDKYTTEAVIHTRDHLREDIGVLCPRAVLEFAFKPVGGGVEVSANIGGDTSPIPVEEVRDYLLSEGVDSVTFGDI